MSVDWGIIERRRWADTYRGLDNAIGTVEAVEEYAVQHGKVSASLLMHCQQAHEHLEALEALVRGLREDLSS